LVESVTEEIVKRLGIHITKNCPSIKSVLEYFPEPNEKLVFPAVSITVGKPVFRALQPYEKDIGTITNNKADVEYVVGIYDIPIQLDLWTRNKQERDDEYELLFAALNPKIIPMGLALQLTNYYNQWCRYDVSGYENAEDEGSSQRGEWRVKVDLLSTCKAILKGKQFVMTTIENQLEVLDLAVKIN
jgi:hypothetical protein